MTNLKSVPFTIYDDLGNILSSGYCQEAAYSLQVLEEGHHILQVSSDPNFDTVNVDTQEIVFNSKIPESITYAEARQQVYPSVAEQLDMIWHAMDSNTMPKAEPFYSTIKLIKEAYPKDGSAVPGSRSVVIL